MNFNHLRVLSNHLNFSNNMNYKKIAKAVFMTSGIYDLALGLAFLFYYKPIFEYLSIAIPAFPEYLKMSAAFVAVLGIGYIFIANNIDRNRDLWKLGIFYKITYVAIVFYYYFVTETANVVFMYFGIIDILFLIPFICLYKKVYK